MLTFHPQNQSQNASLRENSFWTAVDLPFCSELMIMKPEQLITIFDEAKLVDKAFPVCQ